MQYYTSDWKNKTKSIIHETILVDVPFLLLFSYVDKLNLWQVAHGNILAAVGCWMLTYLWHGGRKKSTTAFQIP